MRVFPAPDDGDYGRDDAHLASIVEAEGGQRGTWDGGGKKDRRTDERGRMHRRRDEMRGDGWTFWASSEEGLGSMLKRVGFSEVETLYGWESTHPNQRAANHYRLWTQAWR